MEFVHGPRWGVGLPNSPYNDWEVKAFWFSEGEEVDGGSLGQKKKGPSSESDSLSGKKSEVSLIRKKPSVVRDAGKGKMRARMEKTRGEDENLGVNSLVLGKDTHKKKKKQPKWGKEEGGRREGKSVK